MSRKESVNKKVVCSLLIALLVTSLVLVTLMFDDTVSATPTFLEVTISGENKLGVDDPGVYVASVVGGSGDYSFSWSISPTDKTLLEPVRGSCTLTFTEATIEPYVLTVKVTDMVNGQVGSTSKIVYDPVTLPDYHLSVASNPYNYMIAADGTGWFYVVNGTSGAVVTSGTNTTALEVSTYAYGNGNVVLNQIQHNSLATVPANVTVIELYQDDVEYFGSTYTFNGAVYGTSFNSTTFYVGATNVTGNMLGSWLGAWNTSVAQIIGNAAITWGQITNANATIQQLVALYESTDWSGTWNATVTDIIGDTAISWSQITNADVTVNNLITSASLSWGQITNANTTVQQIIDAYTSMAWKSGWNATVEDIITILFTTQSWNSDWNTTVNSLIAGASLSWSQITNANTTVQQIVDAYSAMAWKSGWNATVAQIASSGLGELASLIVSGTGTFGNVTLSSGHFPTDIDYTIYQSGGTIYAKYSDGTIDFSGTNASTVIQSTLNALENTYTLSTEASLSQDTGTVFVKAGNYTIDSPITIDKRIHLVGSDSGQTWFVASANLSPAMLIINASNLRFQDWGIQNIAIDMVTYTGNGIYSTNAGSSGSRCVGIIEDVIVYNVQSGYSGVELTNPFHLRIATLRVSSSGTGVKFLQSGNTHYGNSLFQDWMLWATGDNSVGLNVTTGGSYRACNLAQFDRVQVQGTASDSGTVGVYWDGNSLSDYVTFNNLNIERMETGVMFVNARYFTFVEPYIWTDEDNADNYAMRITGASREIKVLGGILSCGANADAMAYSDESTSTSYKHLLQNVFLETYWGSFGTNTRLENVNAYRLGAGTTRQNQYSGTATNTSATQIQFDHGCFNNPNILECSFNTTAVSGWSWTTTISTVTLTYTGSGLPASVQVTFSARYDPTFGDPS